MSTVDACDAGLGVRLGGEECAELKDMLSNFFKSDPYGIILLYQF